MSDIQPISTIGIIMDGNRRYARVKEIPKKEGHMAGFEKLLEVGSWARDKNIKHLVVYAFSTENWNREETEVTSLMELLSYALEARELRRSDTKIRIIGDLSALPKLLQTAVHTAEKDTKENGPFTLTIAISYGARAEIVQAVNTILASGVQHVNEDDFQKNMWGGDITPDIIIRTGGDKRLSNFLLWQSAYSELFFVDTLWPDFSKHEFDEITSAFLDRKRNFGK